MASKSKVVDWLHNLLGVGVGSIRQEIYALLQTRTKAALHLEVCIVITGKAPRIWGMERMQ